MSSIDRVPTSSPPSSTQSSPPCHVGARDITPIAIACLGGAGLITASWMHFRERYVRQLAAAAGVVAVIYGLARMASLMMRSSASTWTPPEPRPVLYLQERELKFIQDRNHALNETSQAILSAVAEGSCMSKLSQLIGPLRTLQEEIDEELKSAVAESPYAALLKGQQATARQVAESLQQAFDNRWEASKGELKSPLQSVIEGVDTLQRSVTEQPRLEAGEDELVTDALVRARNELVHRASQRGHPSDRLAGTRLRPRGKLLQMATARDQILAGVAMRLGLKSKVYYSEVDGRITYTSRLDLLLELMQALDPRLESETLLNLLGHLCVEADSRYPEVTDWEHRNAMMRYFNDLVHSDWWTSPKNEDARIGLRAISAAIFEDVKLADFGDHALRSLAKRGGWKQDAEASLLDQMVGFQDAVDTALKTDEYSYGSELTYDRTANDMGYGATLLRYNMPWSNGTLRIGEHTLSLLRTGTPTEDYWDQSSGQRRTRLIGPYVAYLEQLETSKERVLHINLQKAVDPNVNKRGLIAGMRGWLEATGRAAMNQLSPYGQLVEPEHTARFILEDRDKNSPYDLITLSMEQALSKTWLMKHPDTLAFTEELKLLMKRPVDRNGEFYGLKNQDIEEALSSVWQRRFDSADLNSVDERRELVLFTYAELTRRLIASGKYQVLQSHCKDGQDRRAILWAALMLDQMAKEGKLTDTAARFEFLSNLFLPSYVNSARGIHHGRFEMIKLIVRKTEERAKRLKEQELLNPISIERPEMRHEQRLAAGVFINPMGRATPQSYLNWLHFANPQPEDFDDASLQQAFCAKTEKGGHDFVQLVREQNKLILTVTLGKDTHEVYEMHLSANPQKLSAPTRVK